MPLEITLVTPPLKRLTAVENERRLLDSLAKLAGNPGVSAALFPGIAANGQDRDLLAKLCQTVQDLEVAAMIEGSPHLVTDIEADGLHLESDMKSIKAARRELGEGFILGAGGLRNRHDAMEAGEAGADYVAFGGIAAPIRGAELEVISWWQVMMELPAVAFIPADRDMAALAKEAGADFLALGLSLTEDTLALSIPWDDISRLAE